MKTIILEQPEQFRLTETEPPAVPGPNEALVRVHRVGICGTDLHAFEGKQPFFSYPRILGHELGVEVVALGPSDNSTTVAVGDKCAIQPYLSCGHCSACRRGKTNCCEKIQVLGVHIDGGMRELITVPVDKLYPSKILPLEILALVEPMCIGAHAVRRADIAPGENVLVIGAGPIGLAALQSAQLVDANVIMMEVSEQRLAFCRNRLGLAHVIDGKADPLAQLRELLGGELPTVVMDATGSAVSMMNAYKYVAHGGKLVYVGLVRGELTFPDPDIHSRELTIYRSRNATDSDFAWVIEQLETGKVDLTPWITHRATPEQMVEEFGSWLNPDTGVVKAVLEW
jgi:hypothetical protein